MLIAWTTTSQRAEAEHLAREAVEAQLAACAQVDGPINSFYRWRDKLEQAEEFRVTFKYLESKGSELQTWVHAHHPYATPEWIVIRPEAVGEKYLSWVEASSTSRPFPASK